MSLRLRSSTLGAVLLGLAVFMSACSDDESTGPNEPAPLVGVYALTAAEGNALPAVIFNDSTGDEENRFHLRVLALEGELKLTADGKYEQVVRHEVYIDGVLSDRPRWSDRGSYLVGATLIYFESEVIQNVDFLAQRSSNRLDVTTDIIGEGLPVSYRYTRN